MIQVQVITLNPFGVNGYIVYDETLEAILVDVACNSRHEEKLVIEFIGQQGIKPVAIINTHGHLDHICGNNFLSVHYNIPVWMHTADNFLVQTSLIHARMYGFEMQQPAPPDHRLDDIEVFRFGNSELQVLHVPGHSPGSVALYSEAGQFVITGDALFAGSIGRTDLPKGNYHSLIESITSKLLVLPENTQVLPGHMESSTIGNEKAHNPYLND